MPTIKTKVDAATYEYLVRQRKAEGLPSVSALFLKKCNALDDRMEASEIVRRAHRRAKRRIGSSPYRLRDLFSPNEWEGFSKGARLRAGRMFYDKISSAVDGIRPAQKSPSNHQFYITAVPVQQPHGST
jgi:hypothetical protein